MKFSGQPFGSCVSYLDTIVHIKASDGRFSAFKMWTEYIIMHKIKCVKCKSAKKRKFYMKDDRRM